MLKKTKIFLITGIVFFFIIGIIFYLNKQTVSINNLKGEWFPYKILLKNKEIQLQEYFGTSINYGNFLTLNEDKTYTDYIGIYEDENDVVGTFKVKGNKIIFTSKNGDKKEALIIEDEKEKLSIKLNIDDYTIYYEKVFLRTTQ